MICIVTFSALALITANSDYQLSQKVATKSTSYYLAEKEAYTTIAMIDQQLQKIYFAFCTACKSALCHIQCKADTVGVFPCKIQNEG